MKNPLIALALFNSLSVAWCSEESIQIDVVRSVQSDGKTVTASFTGGDCKAILGAKASLASENDFERRFYFVKVQIRPMLTDCSGLRVSNEYSLTSALAPLVEKALEAIPAGPANREIRIELPQVDYSR